MTARRVEEFKLDERHTFTLAPCGFCGARTELWHRYEGGDVWTKAVCCTTFDGVKGDACPLHVPPDDFWLPTKREAVDYWNAWVTKRFGAQHNVRL